MGKKKRGKLEHEMFRQTAIDDCWDRVKDKALDDKKALFIGEDKFAISAKISESLQLTYRLGALELFRVIDSWLYTAFVKGDAMVSWVQEYITVELEEKYEAPGFVDPQTGQVFDKELREFVSGHVVLMTALCAWGEVGRFTYTLSQPLAQMLLHTKLSRLPCDQLRLPQKTIYVSPPVGTWPDTVLSEESLEYQHRFWGVKGEVFTFANVDGVLIMAVNKGKQQEWVINTVQSIVARTGKTVSFVPLGSIVVGSPDISAGEAIKNAEIYMREDPSPE